ncbi:MAG: hypothetical protein J5940_02830, partial [Clostridia bacterium]|nr:hypothetical protein [Clostridia bacterium]
MTFSPEDGRDFVIEKLEERSEKKRGISDIINTMIREYIERFETGPQLLGPDDVSKLESLYADLHDIKTGRYFDLGVSARISKILKEYYSRAGGDHDYMRMLNECVMCDRLLLYNHMSVSCESQYLSECTKLAERFGELSEEDALILFYVLYFVILDHEDDRKPEGAPHPVDQLMRVDGFLTKSLGDKYSEYLEKVGAIGVVRHSLSQILEHYLWSARNHKKADTERLRPLMERYTSILRERMDKELGNSAGVKMSVQSSLLHADYQLGRITMEELLEKLTEMQAEEPENESPIVRAKRLGELNYYYFVLLYRFSGYGKKTVTEMSQKRIRETLPNILKIKREVNNHAFNMFLMLFIVGASYTSRFEDFSNLLLEMTIYSDKALYIHTEMVKEISLVLFDHMIETSPDVFGGVAGYDTEYIISHKREMRRLLSDCCMFHDIGKFFMLDIVENSMRRLTDAEFAIIKTHPAGFDEFGRDWIEQDERLQCIRDCAMTHHLWHNGKNGYPDVSHTKNRPFADILAIADSIDAATDYIGRPYHTGKTLGQLISEIQSEAGTRYGPEAAAALSAPEVKEKLLYLTAEKRKDINYRIYAFNKI